MKVVKLVSGGIDSYILSRQFDGINVYIDFGQSYTKEEQAHLNKLGVKYDIVKVSAPELAEDGIYIPNRNLTLACLVTTLYNPDIIYIAGLKDDNCIDKNEIEFAEMSRIISRYAGKQVQVLSPYWNRTKGDIIADFEDKDSLINTFSCYSPKNGEACLNCPACLRRIIGLETNGVKSEGPLSWDILHEYMQKIHTYDSDRISRFFIYLKQQGYKMTTFDIDGILCENEPGFNYLERKPIKENIDKVNSFEGLHILFTARLERDRQITKKWLDDNGVKYDCLIMNKLPYKHFIDDQACGLWCDPVEGGIN